MAAVDPPLFDLCASLTAVALMAANPGSAPFAALAMRRDERPAIAFAKGARIVMRRDPARSRAGDDVEPPIGVTRIVFAT